MIVALSGILISLFAYFIAFPSVQNRRLDIYLALVALHVAAAIAYWLLGFESAMDAYQYYRDSLNMMQDQGFRTGTWFITWVVQVIKSAFGGSILDHFLFFQCFGMIGIALLIRIFNEVADSLGMSVPLHVYLILFLPGLHFWSVGIGKDAPMIMALCLAAWAMVRLQERYYWLVIALTVMALIRPHVATLAMIPIALTLFFTSALNWKFRVLFGPLAVIGLIVTFTMAQDRLGVQLDLKSISDFVEAQQQFGEELGRGANIFELSFPMKLFTLLFRPLFFDSPNLMGYVVSVENVLLLYIFGYIFAHWRMVLYLSRRVPYFTFCVIFSPLLITLLALVTYNIGLGHRQKMMAVPAVLLIYGTLYMYKRYLVAEAFRSSDEPTVEALYVSAAKA